ncbi:MAG: RNA polymerase sigma factor [Clostridia bacterium]|nr:RNA polymerase sigma factor [Clostridia bacterium]
MTSKNIFDKVYNDFFKDVYSYFSLCFDIDTAEDLTQQTFLGVWRFMKEKDSLPFSNTRAFVFRCAVNVKNDYLRRKQARPKESRLEASMLFGYTYSHQTTQQIAVGEALKALDFEDRDVLLLKNMGLSSSDIGKAYGISASAARSKLSKARLAFRKELEKQGVNIE